MYKIESGVSKDKMRYFIEQGVSTWGDYFIKDGVLNFQIVEHKNDIYSRLTLIHELIEQMLLEAKGVNIDDIDKFDFEFEKDPERTSKYFESGDDPNCPYKAEHDYADSVLKEMCTKMNINFEDYINDEL